MLGFPSSTLYRLSLYITHHYFVCMSTDAFLNHAPLTDVYGDCQNTFRKSPRDVYNESKVITSLPTSVIKSTFCFRPLPSSSTGPEDAKEHNKNTRKSNDNQDLFRCPLDKLDISDSSVSKSPSQQSSAWPSTDPCNTKASDLPATSYDVTCRAEGCKEVVHANPLSTTLSNKRKCEFDLSKKAASLNAVHLRRQRQKRTHPATATESIQPKSFHIEHLEDYRADGHRLKPLNLAKSLDQSIFSPNSNFNESIEKNNNDPKENDREAESRERKSYPASSFSNISSSHVFSRSQSRGFLHRNSSPAANTHASFPRLPLCTTGIPENLSPPPGFPGLHHRFISSLSPQTTPTTTVPHLDPRRCISLGYTAMMRCAAEDRSGDATSAPTPATLLSPRAPIVTGRCPSQERPKDTTNVVLQASPSAVSPVRVAHLSPVVSIFDVFSMPT